MAALAACMLLPVACGMHENGPAEQLVSGVVMPSGAEPYAPGAELTVTGEGFAPDDRILFEIHWTGGSGSFAPEGYAKGVFGTVTALTEHSVSFLAPAHYPASTVSVILFRGGDMQTLGRIRVADGVHEPGLYALALSGAGTMQPVRIDPATGDAAPFGSPVAVGPLHSVVSASGSGILSGLDGDGRLVAIDLVTHRPTPEEGGWLALGTVNPGEVFRFGRGKEPGQLVMSGSGSRMWNLPESLSVEMLEPYPVVRASSSLLLSAALMISLLACGAFAAKTESGVRIAGLKGPTTMGLVNLLDMERSGKASQHYDLQLYGAADEIVPKLIKGELDMAAIPANLAATLYQKTNGGIQVMAVNTLGVLYVVEKGDSVHSFADLKGRTILSTGKGTTPEYVLCYLLTKNGLDPDKDVKIEYYSEASEVTAQMAASKKDAIAVLPQPYVTAAQLKDSSLRVVLDLTKEWNKVCDTQLITGVTVVRTEYAKENPDIVANFLRDYEKSIKAAQTDIAGTAALCEETGVVAKKAIAQKALPQCNIVYRVGDEMKADVNAYLKVLYDASPAAVGGKLPDANFYYTKATPGQVFWRSVQRSFQ